MTVPGGDPVYPFFVQSKDSVTADMTLQDVIAAPVQQQLPKSFTQWKIFTISKYRASLLLGEEEWHAMEQAFRAAKSLCVTVKCSCADAENELMDYR